MSITTSTRETNRGDRIAAPSSPPIYRDRRPWPSERAEPGLLCTTGGPQVTGYWLLATGYWLLAE